MGRSGVRQSHTFRARICTSRPEKTRFRASVTLRLHFSTLPRTSGRRRFLSLARWPDRRPSDLPAATGPRPTGVCGSTLFPSPGRTRIRPATDLATSFGVSGEPTGRWPGRSRRNLLHANPGRRRMEPTTADLRQSALVRFRVKAASVVRREFIRRVVSRSSQQGQANRRESAREAVARPSAPPWIARLSTLNFPPFLRPFRPSRSLRLISAMLPAQCRPRRPLRTRKRASRREAGRPSCRFDKLSVPSLPRDGRRLSVPSALCRPRTHLPNR